MPSLSRPTIFPISRYNSPEQIAPNASLSVVRHKGRYCIQVTTKEFGIAGLEVTLDLSATKADYPEPLTSKVTARNIDAAKKTYIPIPNTGWGPYPYCRIQTVIATFTRNIGSSATSFFEWGRVGGVPEEQTTISWITHGQNPVSSLAHNVHQTTRAIPPFIRRVLQRTCHK